MMRKINKLLFFLLCIIVILSNKSYALENKKNESDNLNEVKSQIKNMNEIDSDTPDELEKKNENQTIADNKGNLTNCDINSSDKEYLSEDGKGKIDIVESEATEIIYSTHIQDQGWQNFVNNGQISGTVGKSRRVEAIKINCERLLNVKYQVHIQDIGWQNWRRNGEIAGTQGQSLRLEAIKIELEENDDYSIMYRVHIQDIGWQDWKNDGEIAGTTGKSKRIEAIQIKIIKKIKTGKIEFESPINCEKIYNRRDIEVVGWKMANVKDTKIKVYLDNEELVSKIEYQTRPDILKSVYGYGSVSENVQPGFRFYINSEKISEGEHEIKLELYSLDNELLDVNYRKICVDDGLHIIYNSHIQNIGWQQQKMDGDVSGTEGMSYRIEALKLSLVNMADKSTISYRTHIQDLGWQDWKKDEEIAGTEGKSLRVEAIQIRLNSSEDYSIMYRVHIQDIGWQDWKCDGDVAGSVGKSLRIEAIQIKIVSKIKKSKIKIESPEINSSIYDRKNIEIRGWKLANVKDTKMYAYLDDDDISNKIMYQTRVDIMNSVYEYGTSVENPKPGFKCTIDSSYLSEGKHKIKLVLWSSDNELLTTEETSFFIDDNLHIKYSSHVQDIGWQKDVIDGATSGTEGMSYRIEAVKIALANVIDKQKVNYRVHIQDIGWQSWKSNGELAGTEGRSKRIEAIQIKLENMDEYTIEYQVHIQDYGWSDCYIDGETAGTIGKSKRIEAIRIRIVKKYKRGYMGIDVSQYNKDINWANVKNSGIDFAMIRVGFRGWGQAGNFKEDANFKTNIQNAKAAGLKVGVYFVTQAKNDQESIQEANWVLDKIRNYHLDYPVALDIESSTAPNNTGRADNLDKNTRGRLAKIFCQTIQNSGYVPMIYLNVDWAKNRVDMSQLTEYDTWIANYKHDLTLKPSYSGKYTIWQYTDIGRINGINTKVDVNISYKRYE